MMVSDVGVVVIGRNEGDRLQRCLSSVLGKGAKVIYVDSGSSDSSVETALRLADEVHQLDPAKPFSAARARNEGFDRLRLLFPQIKFVQFIDGDCVLADGWIEAAIQALQDEPLRAAVIGHLQECNADASVYNRLCALEWKSPAGDIANFGALGGISMMRANVFAQLGGFNPQVIAGEDSEFGVRLSLAGYRVTKIDHAMATHDANMTIFGQWWRRSVRAGHAIGQRAHLNGDTMVQDCVKERRSTLFWGVGIPLAVIILLLPTRGMSLLLLLLYFVLGWRVFWFRRNYGDTQHEAWIYTCFVLLAKLANGVGLVKFYLNRLKQRYDIIEYK